MVDRLEVLEFTWGKKKEGTRHATQCERATLRDTTTRCLSCFFVTAVCGVITVSTTIHCFSCSFDTVRGPGKGKGCWMQAPGAESPNVPLLVPAARKRRARLPLPLDVNGIVVACAFQESDGPWPSPPFRDFYGRTPVLPPQQCRCRTHGAHGDARDEGCRSMASRRRAPSHTWRAAGPCAPPWGSCHSARGIKGDAGRATGLGVREVLAFSSGSQLPLPGAGPGLSLALVACSSPPEKEKSERKGDVFFPGCGPGRHVGPARWIGAGRREEETGRDTSDPGPA